VIEVISGQTLGQFLNQNIFVPLSMGDTSFTVSEQTKPRFCELYMRKGQKPGMLALGQANGEGGLRNITRKSDSLENYHRDPISDKDFFYSAGGGLVGTCGDYLRFAQCMLNGGELDGVRILGRKTVEMMTQNQLGRDPRSGLSRDVAMMSAAGYSEASSDSGFGLGFSVVLRPEEATHLTSAGAFSWGGAASTMFWCDPEEDLVVVFATQLRFRDDFELPLNALLHNLVYSCLTDGKTINKTVMRTRL